MRPLFYTGQLGKGTDVMKTRAQGKGTLGTGSRGCLGPKAGVPLECSENSQRAGCLTFTTALRMRYNYYSHSPDEAQEEAPRGLPKVTEKVAGPGFQPSFSARYPGATTIPRAPTGRGRMGKSP